MPRTRSLPFRRVTSLARGLPLPALASALAWPAAAPAQAAASSCGPALSCGTRVRLTTTDGGSLIGTLVRLDADSVRVRDAAAREIGVARADVREVAVPGRAPRTAPAIVGAIVGMPVGAGLGFLLSRIGTGEGFGGCWDTQAACDAAAEKRHRDEARTTATMSLAGAAAGTVLGALVNASIPRIGWRALPADARLTFAPTPSGGVVALHLDHLRLAR